MITHLVDITQIVVNAKNIVVKCFEFASSINRKINNKYQKIDDIELHYNITDNIVEVYINGTYYDCYPYQEDTDKDFLKLVLNTNQLSIVSEVEQSFDEENEN